MKAVSIHFKVRLGYDALETYRISSMLFRPSLSFPLIEFLTDVASFNTKQKRGGGCIYSIYADNSSARKSIINLTLRVKFRLSG